MSDKPPNWSSENPESESDQSQDSPSDQAFRKFNPDWEQEVFGNTGASGYQSEWQKRQDEWLSEGSRSWHRIFRDFLTMGDERDCAYLLNEPTANFNHAYGRYAAVTAIGIIFMIIILAITFPLLPNDAFESDSTTFETRPNTYTSPNNTPDDVDLTGTLVLLCVIGPIGIGINIIFYSLVLLLVHGVATSVYNGTGDYEKLVYGSFTLFTSVYAAELLIMPILWPLMFLTVDSPSSANTLNCLILIIGIPLLLYIYYLYTLVVKTAYQLGWGQAFMSAIGIPFGSFFVIYCCCIFSLTSGSGGA